MFKDLDIKLVYTRQENSGYVLGNPKSKTENVDKYGIYVIHIKKLQ